jgi:hypothetical protein
LHKIFHNPFYAGWVTSERFGIKIGEVRGRWESVVSTDDFQKGLAILHKHDNQKSRVQNHFYLLCNLLWAEVERKPFKMYVSTPSGKPKSYSYYITHAKPTGKKVRISCDVIDDQIEEWVNGFAVDPGLIPQIQKGTQIMDLKRRLSKFQEEEARSGRLYITGKITEKTYDQLRAEWEVKLRQIEKNLATMEREVRVSLDDLDVALALMVINALKVMFTHVYIHTFGCGPLMVMRNFK